MNLTFAPADAEAIPLHVVEQASLADWLSSQPKEHAAWVKAVGFTAALGSHLVVPDNTGKIAIVVAGYGDAARRARGRFHLASVSSVLPEGVYRLEGLPDERIQEEALGWLFSGYIFDRYKEQKATLAKLVAPAGVDAAKLEAIAAGECLTRI